jgi:hypothetical protein
MLFYQIYDSLRNQVACHQNFTAAAPFANKIKKNSNGTTKRSAEPKIFKSAHARTKIVEKKPPHFRKAALVASKGTDPIN